MVTPVKPDGTVQVTTDISRMNKFVMPARFLLPMLPEIFQKVHGSAFISVVLGPFNTINFTEMEHKQMQPFKAMAKSRQ